MSASTSAEKTFTRTQDPTLTAALNALGPHSYTAHRLQHATPEHLHLTTRRCFVGPIPEGWLKTHRKQWYSHYLHIHHASEAPTFSADANVSRQRRMTGVDGPKIRPSFPQPDDITAEESAAADDTEDVELGDSDTEATLLSPPALSVPRARANLDDPALRRDTPEDADHALSSYATAPSRALFSPSPDGADDRSTSKSSNRLRTQRTTSRSSYVTANTELSEADSEAVDGSEPLAVLEHGSTATQRPRSSVHFERPNPSETSQPRTSSAVESSANGLTPDMLDTPYANTSTTSLLGQQRVDQHVDDTNVSGESSTPAAPRQANTSQATKSAVSWADDAAKQRKGDGVVRFNVPENQPRKVEMQVRARLAQAGRKRLPRSFTRGRLRHGEIVKMEKMLVRLDMTTGPEPLEEDFDEKDSTRVETRTLEKWREYMVVCRETDHEDAALALQMYKTRVIPATSETKVKKGWKHEILLDRATTRVNLYSSLDKTVVIWTPKGPRTLIFFLRARSGTNAVEWYHFFRDVLGYHRSETLQVNIPDLRVSLRLDNPFNKLDTADLEQAADGDEMAIARTVEKVQAVASNIIDRCIAMLAKGDEWKEVIEAWTHNDRVGLAWKRYDRLEWVHGANERKMYGTIAMQRTHELELRSKQHYPMTTVTQKGNSITEPAPVEGFLIRLTSQKGVDQKLGKLFFKRLYFTTHNQFFLFLRPTKAAPPPPPKMPMQDKSKIPSAKQIAEKIPLIYAVNPYPVENETIAWLPPNGAPAEAITQHDVDAYDESERNVGSLLNCDGFIDLCNVVQVRKVHRGATPADENVDEGSDIDFDIEVADTRHDDGKTTEFDDDRTFELVMKNGLVVRLQAFSKATKKEWMRRLRDLIKYWTYRTAADMNLFKSVRQSNLQALNIDERAEAYIGSFAQKWEVTKSFASPELYNMCGISSCRAIHNSGTLFRKPRRHSTFTRCRVILCHGHLVIFQDTLRTNTGKKIQHIHHERIAAIDLADAYLYSGLITENDLLYQNRTFDSNTPGNHALPRMFLEDGWTSTDEDPMTCFVIWQAQRKGWFKSSRDVDDVKDGEVEDKRRQKSGKIGTSATKLKRVNQLGVKGRSIVFKARSRAERDHWVLGIGAEIERLAQQEDVRVVEDEKK